MTKTGIHPDDKLLMIQVHGYTHTRLTNWIDAHAKSPKNTSFEQSINLLIDLAESINE